MYAQRFISVAKPRVALPSTRVLGARSISVTPQYQKSPVEAAKETVKKADRVVADAAVKGIDKGAQVAGKVKSEVGGATGETSSKAEQKLSEAKGDVKGTAAEVEGKAKGAASEAAGKAKEAKEKTIG
ncbi:hypothetical protein N7468_004126 [Penicillium chermesinum]|uniref:LEA domain protein n=1 Tax=Penicillium chermesinum TaxID=63820 RepID=A0A9W9P807_9EURO|nr:uncharacterized protein N7468_004126 [Penicillium chermesinum]KAJ5239507.1 hypothetical protein N7468_004126 [Penicillium chermesinum]KAJ6141237.1 hypothetical protein N7470_010133 [Penicillium chermesinum]